MVVAIIVLCALCFGLTVALFRALERSWELEDTLRNILENDIEVRRILQNKTK